MSHQQFGPIYHGSGAWLTTSDEIQPSMHPSGKVGTWGTTSLETAARYAGYKAAEQGTLFSPIYEVEPKEYPVTKYNETVGSKKPMRIKRLAGYGSYEGALL